MPVQINGATSGSTTIQATDAVTTTLTLPATTGTLLSTTAPATGNVIQVVNAISGSQVNTSLVTYVDTGLTATITPKFANSKVLVSVHNNGNYAQGSANAMRFKLVRNSTDILVFESLHCYGTAAANNGAGSSSAEYLDSPATTSATTYKVQFSSRTSGQIITTQYNDGSGLQSQSTITLMEIAG